MSRWLEAIWEPRASIYTLPGGLDMLDVSGDGNARLICADLGTPEVQCAKVRIYKGSDQVMQHNLTNLPCGVVGFYTENGEPRSAVIAVGINSSVYIYKNTRPFFKYCLPHIDSHPKEREIWHKAGLDEELNVLTLADDLELLLKELGAAFISPRTLHFLSLQDANSRATFAERYRRVPLMKSNALTAMAAIRRDNWSNPASSCLILGTEAGEILVLDPRAFTIMDKHLLEWPPVAFASSGLWAGDGRIMIIGRDGRVGAIRRGSPVNLWEKLPAPAVAITTLNGDGAAIAIMDGTVSGFSKRGIKLWRINIPGIIMDLVSLPVPQNGLSLLAVSTAGYGVRIYDGKYHVDTMKIIEPVSAIKYGRMGQEDRTMAMVTVGGGLCVKILKRTADFSVHNPPVNATAPINQRFSIPKKTRLFMEQTIRERTEARKIHSALQQSFLRLRLSIAKNASETLMENQDANTSTVTVEADILGLGPYFEVKLLITNISERVSETGLFLFILCRDENINIRPTMKDLPLLPNGVPIPVFINVTLRSKISRKMQILLCKRGKMKPIVVTNILFPAAEEDIEY